MEMWIFMMRRIRWNRNTVSFGKIHLSQNILQRENAFCRVVQKVNWTLIEELDFEVGFEE